MPLAIFQVGGSGTGAPQTTALTTIQAGRIFYPRYAQLRSNGAFAANQYMVLQDNSTGVLLAQMYGTTTSQSLDSLIDDLPIAGGALINILTNITNAVAWVVTLTGHII
jgi:hypothetical protein